MLKPERIFANTLLRINITYKDDTGALVDPATVVFKLMSPLGKETTFTFGVESELQKLSTGRYAMDVTPDAGGRWHYRWESTGTGTTLVKEDNFIVTASPFVDGLEPRAYCH